jgi:predicted dinucleotide-binding enzyme
MRIGIVGAGKVGGGLGKLWVRAGHEVFFSSRHPNRLKALVDQAGPEHIAVPLQMLLSLGRSSCSRQISGASTTHCKPLDH